MAGKNSIPSFTVIVTFLAIAIAGAALIPLLPVKLTPSRTLPGLTVNFSMPGNSARIVEMEATSRLEAMLARVGGVRNIYSTSGNGWGYITLEFDKHTPIDMARFEASAIIRQTWQELPQEVSYPYISVRRPDENTSRPFMNYTLNSAAAPSVIQQVAENILKPRLSEIGGLYKIEVSGATPMEWQLEYDSDQLQSVGVELNDIRNAISLHYATAYLGMSGETENGEHVSWMRISIASLDDGKPFDASAVTVKNREGRLIRLDQLVKVRHAEQQPSSYYRINGLNSIYISLTAEESANQLTLSQQVKETLQKAIHSLPQGYELHNSYDATDYIRTELHKIYLRSGLTVLILLLFVLLITQNLRYLFLIAVSLVVNLAVAVIFYNLLKLEIQLYSLAGITISLSLIIDNTIVMSDHLLHRRNRKAFMPLLAATLTTVGALCIIFFLDEKIRLNLQDFAAVVMINLLVSLFIALLFVPAMMDKLGLRKRKARHTLPRQFSPRRVAVRFTHLYGRLITVLSRRKWISFTAVVLLFGLPFYKLPAKIENGTFVANQYNKLFNNELFTENVRPPLDRILGGTLRLFTEKVYEGSYFTRNDETVLSITAAMPNGTTLTQMNVLIEKMERYLSSFAGIRQFQTDIPNPRRASIRVYFHEDAERSGFPYQLKNSVISKAMELGGGSWGVYGLEDQGFSNDVRENAGNYRVKFYGYNYDELTAWADTLKNRLLAYRRINEVLINSDFSWYKDDYREYLFVLNKQRLAAEGFLPVELFGSLQPVFARNVWAASIVPAGDREDVVLSSRQAATNDIWALQQLTYPLRNRNYKLGELATISNEQMPQEVGKENQQYRLVLQYDYIGAYTQGNTILEREVEKLGEQLPMGYTVQREAGRWGWDRKDYRQYLLIGLLIVIIFFITSILFNSVKQPLAVIFVIPISFIGVFLTFYLFRLNFDQGGFASFILLSGITVNASIYILNEYNQIRKRKPLLPALQAYLKAWNAKIVPVFLTVVSTMLGFVPFLVGMGKEAFWFPLAAGTIGGLTMSVIGIFLFLPLLLIHKRKMV